MFYSEMKIGDYVLIPDNEFLNSSQDRKIKERLAQDIANLQIEAPDDIVKILGAINQKNQNDKKN
jgi:hypothetical protein